MAEEQLYWMGGLSTSGGSIEWLRSLLGDPPLSYDELDTLLNNQDDAPSGILYFPYLAGSESPIHDPQARAAFTGLTSSHSRADLLKAVLEGTAFELESIRRAAERATGTPIDRLVAAGGGTRNRRWMQIKADISGCTLQLSAAPQATLLGAAMLAGVACGAYGDLRQASLREYAHYARQAVQQGGSRI